MVGAPGPDYLDWVGQQSEREYTILMGANTYHLMSGFAAEAEPSESDESVTDEDAATAELAKEAKVVSTLQPRRADYELLLLKLLLAGELPESWIPPAHIPELRTRVRTRQTLVDQRGAWQLRLAAQLLHQGVPAGLHPARAPVGRALARVELSRAGRALVTIALRMIEVLDRVIAPLERELRALTT